MLDAILIAAIVILAVGWLTTLRYVALLEHRLLWQVEAIAKLYTGDEEPAPDLP